VIETVYAPAAILAALMVNVAVFGNELTDAGLILQLPLGREVGQLRLTVPAKPSCEVIDIDPLPVLPTLTSGKSAGAFIIKSGFDVTFRVKDTVIAEGAPAVVARSVTG